MITKEQREEVQFRIDYEGLDYCMIHYSDWSEVKDRKFHKLRNAYIKASKDLEDYIYKEKV